LPVILTLCCLAGCAAVTAGGSAPGAPDVDLTVMSATMVYGEVNNMMANPDSYMGKTVKAAGPYYVSYMPETGLYYHLILIEDVTLCCQQWLEFIWDGHSYPDGFPSDGTPIEVTGTFGSYVELGETYYYLDADDVVVA
jgi:hypothetical protein